MKAPKAPPFITHKGDWDTLLVRVGHHLWAWHKKDEQNKELMDALEDLWRVKREFRMPLAAQRERKCVLGRQLAAKRGKS